jgi:geranylgeranyl pyrophosphate synthase
VHRLKTGALLGASIALGASCAGLDEAEVDRSEGAGVDLGVAFQMVDDVLDEQSSAEELGKSPGKDRAQGKLTAPAILGATASLERAEEYLRRGREELRSLSLWSPELEALCGLLVHRDR